MSHITEHHHGLDLLAACSNHKKKMLFLASLIMGLTIAYVFVAKHKYTSEAQVFVRLGKESVALDPTATTGQTIGVQESREKEIYSVQSLMRSRNVLERVVDAVGVGKILEESSEPKTESKLPIDLDYVKTFNPLYVDSPRDKAIESLEKGLEIYTPRNTAIVGLRYETISPELAAEVLEHVISATITEHVRVHQSLGSSSFFITQSDQLKAQVEGLEKEMLEFKNRTGVADLDKQRELQIARISQLENAQLTALSELEGVRSEIDSRRELLASQPNEVQLQATTGLASSAAEGMREQLFSLQIREKELLTRYEPTHPRVQQIKEQIEAAQTTMQNEDALTQRTVGLNQNRQSMESALMNQVAIASSLAARNNILTQQIVQAKEQLNEINQNGIRLAELTRKLELANSTYLDYARRSEQARIDLALGEENLSNLSILQPPSVSQIPSSPKLGMILFAGFTLAVFSSMLMAVAFQLRDRRVQSPTHLERLDTPYLGEVSHLPKKRILASEESEETADVG